MEQSALFFDVKYVSPSRTVMTSGGLRLDLASLPSRYPCRFHCDGTRSVDQTASWVTDPQSVPQDGEEELPSLRGCARR